MKRINLLALTFLIFCGTIASCKKDHSPAPPPAPLDSVEINLNFPESTLGGTYPTNPKDQYELIVSEPGGKVLLDTLTGYNTTIIKWLKTNQKLLDVTTVAGWPTTGSYVVRSFKSIDLKRWANFPDNDSIQIPSGVTAPSPPVPGIVMYTHVNTPLGSDYDFLDYGSGQTGQAYSNTIYGRFNAPITDYAYLIFPTLGLYNLHRIATTYDTVDLSNPDIATNVTINKPAIYTTSGFSLGGYPDSNNLAYTVNLTYWDHYGMPLTNVPSLYYPGKKGFKKYTFSYYASDNGNVNFASVNLPYIDTIPNNLTIPDPASYTITKTTDTAVSIKYNTATPTYYEIATSIGAVQFIMTAPGDSTGLHPVSFYRALNSKLLGNLNYSSMQFTYVHFVADAQPDYQTYWAAHSQIYVAWKTPPSAYISFQHHF